MQTSVLEDASPIQATQAVAQADTDIYLPVHVLGCDPPLEVEQESDLFLYEIEAIAAHTLKAP